MGILVKVFFIKEKKILVYTFFLHWSKHSSWIQEAQSSSQSPLHLESVSLVSDEEEEEDDEEESELELLALRRDAMAWGSAPLGFSAGR